MYEALRDEPDRAARLDREFLEFAQQAKRGVPGGSAEYPYSTWLWLLGNDPMAEVKDNTLEVCTGVCKSRLP